MCVKKSLLFLIFSTSLIGVYAFGKESQLQIHAINENHPHHIYFGPEIFLFDINTHVHNAKVDGMQFFGGLRLRYEYLKPEAFYAGIDLLSAISNKSFSASSKGYHFHRNNGITGFGNFEFRLGYTFAPKNAFLTPFIGMGAYAFGNNGHNFHFDESMVYYAAGVRSLFDVSHAFNVGLNLKVLRTDDTEQKFKYIFRGCRIKQKNHDNMWGGELGIPLVWHVGPVRRWEIQLEPYFLKLDFSEIQNIYGARLLFGYLF